MPAGMCIIFLGGDDSLSSESCLTRRLVCGSRDGHYDISIGHSGLPAVGLSILIPYPDAP